MGDAAFLEKTVELGGCKLRTVVRHDLVWISFPAEDASQKRDDCCSSHFRRETNLWPLAEVIEGRDGKATICRHIGKRAHNIDP